MILKEIDAFAPRDAREEAGLKAERETAFYLRRQFADRDDVLVLHDVRLENADGDAAQMDHVILHRGGIVVIENKSIGGRVRVNEHGEWMRSYKGEWRGMPSPLEQADRQVRFLGLLIQEHRAELLRSMLIESRGAGSISYRRIVAVSDGGIIERPEKFDVSDVVKADMLGKRLREVMAEQAKGASAMSFITGALFNREVVWFALSKEEMRRLADLMVENHRPLRCTGKIPARPVAEAIAESATEPDSESSSNGPPAVPACPPLPEHCSKCGSPDAAVLFGKFGYYLKCAACGGNTSLTVPCPACGGKRRISKDGPVYHAVCGRTGEKAVHLRKG